MHAAAIRYYGRYAVAVFAACVFVPAAGAAPVSLPDGRTLEKVDFERHVQGLLGRMGCNAGACHGSFQGKGGLYLSLFGYSAEKDYVSFSRDGMGRRINLVDPDQSLMLLKPSAQVPHGGGKRFEKDSWQYNVIKEWIKGGARWTSGSGAVVRMEVTPNEHTFAKPGETKQFKVLVEFADGSKEDMTLFSDFRVTDDYAAEVAGPGQIRAMRPGDTAAIVSYRGIVRSARGLIPVPVEKGAAYPRVPQVNFIDEEVFAKLRKLNIVPSNLSSDSEFLRRLYIDTIGSLPTPDEVRKFLADKSPNKRAKKIEELLNHPLHAALWATKLSDITGNNVDVMEQPNQLRPRRSKMWHDWLRKRIAENMPYDQIAHGVLCATSREGKEPEDWIKDVLSLEEALQKGFDSDYAKRESLDLFWRRNNFTLEQMAEHTAAAFMGVRMECAQCHKHPFDRWTQADYRSYANIFGQVKFGASPASRSAIEKVNGGNRKAVEAAVAAIEKQFAERKKQAEADLDKENTKRREEVEKKVATESEAKKKEALEAVDKENAARKKAALTKIEVELQQRRQQARMPRQQTQIREVYTDNTGLRQLAHPDTNGRLTAKAPGGPEIELKGDGREALFNWLVQPDNPYFARSFVNRVWAHYFGVGLVEPVDSFSAANPPSNEKLLDALAKDFVAHKYDIRYLERTILASRTYQLSAIPNATNVHDRNNYSRAFVKRMMAEVVVDVLNSALDVQENWGAGNNQNRDIPDGVKAIEVAPNRVQNPNLAFIFRIFGRPPRSASCDCERATEPALPQTLYMMTDQNLLNKITSGRLRKLLADKEKKDADVLEELFLAMLSRFPSDQEKQWAAEHIKSKSDRQAAFVDVVWALLNTREFILNH